MSYYRRLIALRKREDWKETFVYGSFQPAYQEEENLFGFRRTGQDRQALILANFGEEAVELKLEEQVEEVLLFNQDLPQLDGGHLKLRPCEAVVLRVKEK